MAESYWSTRFGRDPSILGQVLTLNGAGYEVVGVMPGRFAFPAEDVSMWLPANCIVSLSRNEKLVPKAQEVFDLLEEARVHDQRPPMRLEQGLARSVAQLGYAERFPRKTAQQIASEGTGIRFSVAVEVRTGKLARTRSARRPATTYRITDECRLRLRQHIGGSPFAAHLDGIGSVEREQPRGGSHAGDQHDQEKAAEAALPPAATGTQPSMQGRQ